MKKVYISIINFVIAVIFFLSCESKEMKNNIKHEKGENKTLTFSKDSLENATDSVKDLKMIIKKVDNKNNNISYLDLSNQSLIKMPDLSTTSITHLNLSNNRIKDFQIEFLPHKLEKLNLSNNKISGEFLIPTNKLNNLRYLNLAHNLIDTVVILNKLRHLNVSNNNISLIIIKHKNIKYLNTLNNPEMDSIVQFAPKYIDTILSDKKLIFFVDVPIIIE